MITYQIFNVFVWSLVWIWLAYFVIWCNTWHFNDFLRCFSFPLVMPNMDFALCLVANRFSFISSFSITLTLYVKYVWWKFASISSVFLLRLLFIEHTFIKPNKYIFCSSVQSMLLKSLSNFARCSDDILTKHFNFLHLQSSPWLVRRNSIFLSLQAFYLFSFVSLYYAQKCYCFLHHCY